MNENNLNGTSPPWYIWQYKSMSRMTTYTYDKYPVNIAPGQVGSLPTAIVVDQANAAILA